ncbi:MAG: PleD family two-component system response regulator [Maricaulaceae bacterium]
MSARILIVDDLVPNLRLLEVKLVAEYYDVVSATNGLDAIDIAKTEKLDLILLDAMMPDMDGFEVCRRLKSDPNLAHIPVIMLTALEESRTRVRGLEAGADDFITKPINDLILMARVRAQLRLKMITDQLLSHTGYSIANSQSVLEQIGAQQARLLIVEDSERRAAKLSVPFEGRHIIRTESDPRVAIQAAKAGTDLVIVSLVSNGFDGLRVCASLRFDEKTKDLPILALGDLQDESRLIRAYDLGVNDLLLRPIEAEEIQARVNSQLRRKFFTDSLRENFNENLEMVISDPLTGLGNRRYFDRQIATLFELLENEGEAFSIMVFDIDHFKRVNDILGHDMGDTILKEVAARLVSNMRAMDIVSRYGGEEFIIAMPKTKCQDALHAAERVRGLVGGTPVYVDGQAHIITTSVGVAEVQPGEKLRDVFKRADAALYKAKQMGRNKVMSAEDLGQAA